MTADQPDEFLKGGEILGQIVDQNNSHQENDKHKAYFEDLILYF